MLHIRGQTAALLSVLRRGEELLDRQPGGEPLELLALRGQIDLLRGSLALLDGDSAVGLEYQNVRARPYPPLGARRAALPSISVAWHCGVRAAGQRLSRF